MIDRNSINFCKTFSQSSYAFRLEAIGQVEPSRDRGKYESGQVSIESHLVLRFDILKCTISLTMHYLSDIAVKRAHTEVHRMKCW